MRIVFKNEEGGLSVIYASPNWKGTMQELAEKDVPTGLKYKIVEDSDIPSDRYFRESWTVSESDLTDGVGA
tara:strand:- start:846 stop:1058 length:213 start_codon:yes stop_codon:yes gene_type:complete